MLCYCEDKEDAKPVNEHRAQSTEKFNVGILSEADKCKRN